MDQTQAAPPRKHRRLKHDGIVALFLAALAIASASYTAITANRQATCNEEFKRVIAQRGAEVEAYDAAIHNLIMGIATLEPPAMLNDPVYTSALADRFVEFDGAYQRLEAERSVRPYPDPRC